MVKIDIPMPPNCDECPINYDYWFCSITHTDINLDTCDKECLPDCPLEEVRNEAEP